MQTACALCGVFIASDAPQQWMKEFRAIYVQDNLWDVVRLSGVGLCRDNATAAPSNYKKRYDDRVLGPGSKINIALSKLTLDDLAAASPNRKPPDRPDRRGSSVSYWGFGFHASCWDLLSACFKPSLRDLFYTCLSVPIGEDGILDWGHLYNGVAQHLNSGPFAIKSLSWEAPLANGFHADPINVPGVHDVITGRISPLVDDILGDHDSFFCPSENTIEEDSFSKLPSEILQTILCHLPSTDVRSLRLASASFATEELSELFWASRFSHEYHYIYETLDASPESWESLYFSIRKLEHGSTGLKNRKRIWGLALQLRDLLMQAGTPCEGPEVLSLLEPLGPIDDISWHKACRGLREPAHKFTSGCRALRSRCVNGSGPLNVRQLFVSTVRLGEETFISGMRFVGKNMEDVCLGYIHPATEKAFEFPPECEHESVYTIAGWYLALDLSGVRGIAALMDNGTLSSWVGDSEGVPLWRLAGEGVWREFSGVKAEFDALKMVSLSRAVQEIGFYSDRTMVTCSLWTPHVPPADLYYDGSQRFSFGDTFELPFSVLMFGGTKGRDLHKLLEIVVWICGADTLTGFEFSYADISKNRTFGQVGWHMDKATEKVHKYAGFSRFVMPMDGPGGEAIKTVQVLQYENSIHGLKIRTNTGKSASFPPNYPKDAMWTTVKPYGSTVVGFYAKCDQRLCNIGLISDNSISLEGVENWTPRSHRRRKSRLSISQKVNQLFRPHKEY